MSDVVNLVKLCVGAERVEDLETWQAHRRATLPGYQACHVTRMWPKRREELLNGGALYWVFKGFILARQQILDLQEMPGEDGINRCGLMLDDKIIRTESVPRRPFQGWRYLAAADSPRDLKTGQSAGEALPQDLISALAEIGVR